MPALGLPAPCRLAAVIVVLALAAGCSSDEGGSASTTTASTTTLPPSSTTTTMPARAVTGVDGCSLLREVDLDRVLEDSGVGESPPAEETAPDAGVPALVTAECSWPSRADPALSLHYLAPTTAPDGPTHLTDVLATGSGFAEGGRVLTQPVQNEVIGVLIDDAERIREVAVVKRSALLYLLVEQDVSARDTEALTAYAEILYNALVRAPR
jgi:hypothetical protein